MAEQDPQVRIGNFSEVALGYTEEEAFLEAERCLMCTDPTCISGCPVEIDIPGFIQKICDKDIRGAYDIMMKACAETTRPHGIKTVVSLNPIMVDGTGMCGGCRVSVEGKMKFGCVDGPDFDAHKVDFDELLLRLSRFVPKEKQALEHWQNECRIQQQADQLVDQQTKH